METITATMEKSGRLLIPADWRRKMNLEPGSEVVLRMDESGIRLLGDRRQILKRIQDKLSIIQPDRVLSEELIAERREAAAAE